MFVLLRSTRKASEQVLVIFTSLKQPKMREAEAVNMSELWNLFLCGFDTENQAWVLRK
jgi:hypothetical protein